MLVRETNVFEPDGGGGDAGVTVRGEIALFARRFGGGGGGIS